ncbi:MAG: S41 family peptidase [Longimicrobiales bacterium]
MRSPILITLGLAACIGEPPAEKGAVDHSAIVRTGYFESDLDPDDWRVRFIQGEDARQDLEVLDSLLSHHYAYNDADELDESAVLEAISAALPEAIRVGDFAMQLQKALALSIDGHAPRIAGLNLAGERERIEDNPPGTRFVPFELRSTGSRIVAFDGSTRTLVDPVHPFVAEIDGVPTPEWIDAAQSIIVAGSPQLRWHRGSWQLGNIDFLRMELGRPSTETATFTFEDETRASRVEVTVELVDESAAARERYPLGEDALARVPDDIAYFRIRRMESDAEYIAGFAAWIQDSRGARGAIVDIRDNGGGSRLPLLTLLPHVLDATAPPIVVNAGRLKLEPGCPGPGCETPQGGYLADRFMLPLRAIPVDTPEKAALDVWLPGFTPEWSPPEAGFSDWHYLVVAPDPDPAFFGKPVIVLMNNGNFSASDIFLSGLVGREGVTLIGTPSSGGSARRREHILPGSDLVVSLATLASFQARNGRLYDGVGVEPDIYMEAEPAFFVNGGDEMLARAIELIRASAGESPGGE